MDATKKLTEEYKSKNNFRYVNDGIEYTTPAFDFHIFSTEAILSAHTNGNIATKDLDAGGQGFGASQSSSLKLNEENYIQNSADNITQIKSDGNNKRNLKINIVEGQTLIINVDMIGVDKDYLANLVTKINDYGNTEQVIGKENNVLWNLYDSLREDKLFTTSDYAKVGTGDYFMGIILAPNANIEYGALNGNLIANKVKNDGQESHKWDFTGELEDSKSTSVILEGTKNLIGKDLTEGMLEFKVVDKDNNVVSKGKNDKDGNIYFAVINYTEAGTYTYKVKEVVGELGGITYDTTVFEVIVTVVDNGNGQLVATVNYPEDGIEFSNKYTKKNVINTTTNKNNTPKTGDNGYGYILGIVLLAVGALLINNKRKNVEN